MFRGNFPPKEAKGCALLCTCYQEERNRSILNYAILLTKECEAILLMKERCLPHLQGHTCPVLPSGVCSSLYPRPVIFHLQKPSFLLLCYLQDTTLSLFSPVTPDIL